jgi:hypothetical protein
MKEGKTWKLHTITLQNLKNLNQTINQPRKTT